jgi:photosystem II stability/assembly factor-like uncharacterized protein
MTQLPASPTASPISTSLPSPTPLVARTISATVALLPHADEPIKQLVFVDAQHGWMISDRTLLATTDGGAQWSKQITGDLVRLFMADARHGWLATKTALLHTSDGGAQWRAQPIVWPPDVWYRLQVLSVQQAWAFSNVGLFATSDGGATWRLASAGRFWSASFFDARHGWAALTHSNEPAEDVRWSLMRTSDGGSTWAEMAIPCDERLREFRFKRNSGRGGWLFCLETIPEFHAQPKQLFKTSDDGHSWQLIASTLTSDAGRSDQLGSLTRDYISGISFSGARDGWMTTYNFISGLDRTTDGGHTWEHVPLVRFIDDLLHSDTSDPNLISTHEGYLLHRPSGQPRALVLHTSDGGTSWQQIAPPVAPRYNHQFLDAQNGFGSGTFLNANDILRTHDGGATWSIVGTIEDTCPIARTPLAQLGALFADQPPQLWAISSCGSSNAGDLFNTLHRSDDGGASWTTLMTSTAIADLHQHIPTVQPSSQWKIDGYFPNGRLLATSDGGTTWTPLLSGENVVRFALLPDGSGWVIANRGYDERRLLKTEDGGRSWIEVQTGLMLHDVYLVDDQHGWLLSNGQLFRTEDGGLSWAQLH